MKKILIIGLFAIFAVSSCKKEDEKCNCGTITDDGITYNNDGTSCYWLEIRNECSNNKKTWCFDYDVWFDGNVGEDFCVYNENRW